MFRNDTNSARRGQCVLLSATAGQGVDFEFRTTAGGLTTGTEVNGIALPVWVEVVRSSDQFSGYYSVNGTKWIQVGSTVTIEMAGPALGGSRLSAPTTTPPSTHRL